MKNVLVTGGTGFIGSHTAVALHEAGYRPILLDNLSNSERGVLAALKEITGQDFPFFEGDCRDKSIYKKIHDAYPFDSVIHFAASKAVGESVEKPLMYFDNNLTSSINLMESMLELGVDKLIFSSSCTVYGNPENTMVTEQTPMAPPSSPYGYTKLICEQMIEQVVTLNQKFSAVLLRYFNPVGAHETALIGEKPVGIPNNLVPFVTQTAIGIREKLLVFGNDYDTRDGSCIRDFIHVCDVADAHVASLRYLESKGIGETFKFNVGTGTGTSVLELIKAFEDATGVKLNWEVSDRRAGDVIEIYANTEFANKELNWKAKRDINQAMKDAWRWEKRLNS